MNFLPAQKRFETIFILSLPKRTIGIKLTVKIVEDKKYKMKKL